MGHNPSKRTINFPKFLVESSPPNPRLHAAGSVKRCGRAPRRAQCSTTWLGGFLGKKTEHRNTAHAHEYSTRSRIQHKLATASRSSRQRAEAYEYSRSSRIQQKLTAASRSPSSEQKPPYEVLLEHRNTEKATQLTAIGPRLPVKQTMGGSGSGGLFSNWRWRLVESSPY